jgi:hypothetical protein
MAEDFLAQRMERVIDRQMRKVLQRELLATMRQGTDPFLETATQGESPKGSQGFVILRGGALTHAIYPKPEEVSFYNDPYNRVPQMLRLSIFTQERDEDFAPARGRPSDATLVEHRLQSRHDHGYRIGLAYMHDCFRQMGAEFTRLPSSAAQYGLVGDGVLKKSYSREEMLPHFSAPHLSEAARYLPERLMASTEFGLMPCIGLVPPDPELGWKLYTEGKTNDGKTRYFPQDLRRMLSVTLSLLATYGQDPANAEKNGDALAAWMLDTYNATSALGDKIRLPETKEMVGGLSLLTMAAMGASLERPRDPASMAVPFFLQGLESGQEQDASWLTRRLNTIGDWDVRVNNEFTRALLAHTLMTYRNVFPGFGKTKGNAFNFTPDAADVSRHVYHRLSHFVPNAVELFDSDLRLDGEAFARAYPNVAADHPSLIHRANNVMRADFSLPGIEDQSRQETEQGLKAHKRMPGKLSDKRPGRPGMEGQGGSGEFPGH